MESSVPQASLNSPQQQQIGADPSAIVQQPVVGSGGPQPMELLGCPSASSGAPLQSQGQSSFVYEEDYIENKADVAAAFGLISRISKWIKETSSVCGITL